MYHDPRRKTVTYMDIRAVIADQWPRRKQLPLWPMSVMDEWWQPIDYLKKDQRFRNTVR